MFKVLLIAFPMDLIKPISYSQIQLLGSNADQTLIELKLLQAEQLLLLAQMFFLQAWLFLMKVNQPLLSTQAGRRQHLIAALSSIPSPNDSATPTLISQKYANPFKGCRVKRHLIFTTSHLHGSPAETKPERTIFTQNFFSKIVTDFRKAEIVLHV